MSDQSWGVDGPEAMFVVRHVGTDSQIVVVAMRVHISPNIEALFNLQEFKTKPTQAPTELGFHLTT